MKRYSELKVILKFKDKITKSDIDYFLNRFGDVETKSNHYMYLTYKPDCNSDNNYTRDELKKHIESYQKEIDIQIYN